VKAAVVGLTLDWCPTVTDEYQVFGRWRYCLNQTYALLVDRPDIIPVAVIPRSGDPGRICSMLDLLLLTGGGDPDPRLYGQEIAGALSVVRERPLWEMELYRTARRMGVPVLGICLGQQLIAMAEGAGLIQDIPSQVAGALDHYGKAVSPKVHPVSLEGGTILGDILGSEAVVSSFHHQAIAFVPDGFRLVASSSDGVIEAIESVDGGVVAVQWHPERDYTGTPILDALLARQSRGKGRSTSALPV
jgi:putative glutamine amidotransferase